MKTSLRLFAAVAVAMVAVASTAATYKNPILPMDFSDPDVCVGRDGKFYMTASSFGGVPGLPILVSDDLVNWQYALYALAEHPFATRSPEHGNAVWAPSIRYRADRKEYVIYWGDPDRGAYRVSASDPRGPWSEPRLVVPGKGLIDPCPLYDDDGRIYLVSALAQSRAGMNSVILVRELDADETKAISDPVIVYDGVPDGNFTAEGPKFYKHNGEYWLFFPAGGVSVGWQVAARSKSPYGPFKAKTVMAQGKSKINGPHQGAWVKTPAGEDWFVHFSDRDAYGRIVYLEPMKWLKNGWPVIGVDNDADGCGEPVEEYEMPKGGTLGEQRMRPQSSDEFNDLTPGPQWQWLGKSYPFPGFGTPYGYYRLYTTKCTSRATRKSSFISSKGFDIRNLWTTPNLMVQKFPGFSFSATMKAQVGAKELTEECGLIVQGRSYARLGLKYADDNKFEVVYVECRDADKHNEEKCKVLATIPAKVIEAGLRSANVKDIWLKVDVAPGEVPKNKFGPKAICTFYWSLDGETWNECETKFEAREGKWIGATVGIYAVSSADCTDRGWIDIDYFRVR